MDDCGNCSWQLTELLPENRTIWRLWSNVQTQWRTSFGGLVGLDYTAVYQVAEMFRLEWNPRLWNGLRLLEMHYLKLSQENLNDNGGGKH